MAKLKKDKEKFIREILAQQRIAERSGQVGQSNDSASRFINSRLERSQMGKLKAKERADLIEFRKMWSNWTLFFVGLIVVSNVVIVLCVGFGILRFENQNIIPYFIGDSVIKTIGLAYIIVNFLFSRDSMNEEK